MAIKKTISILLLVIAAFGLGYLLRGCGNKDMPSGELTQTEGPAHNQVKESITLWTCSMHPQTQMSAPGQCPICGMELIPTSGGDGNHNTSERELRLSPAAVKLAEIQTLPVERKHVRVKIRMVGKVDYDETRLAHISAWVSGRIDRLYVDYTGISVRKGDHMVYLYSPELLTAQQELLQAQKAVNELKGSNFKIMRNTALETVKAVQEKLRLWGLTEKQIYEIKKRGKATDHITIYAPMGGVVIKKNIEEGAYIKTGAPLYTIADFSSLWIKLDAYESDLVWLRYGQEVDIATEAYPGQVFKGAIAFIDPALDTKTRTVKVRVSVTNADGLLKPEMFVHATVHARVAASGRVMNETLAGKWICPMHPDVVKDKVGSCDICGMPLVRPETLGYVSVSGDKENIAPLVIPASAPLITGKRAIVYVADPEKKGFFEGREIILGPRAGDYYLVKEGVKEGEKVVVHGNFKIDSALQILAKPSMMSPKGGVAAPGHAHHGAMSMPDKKASKRDKPPEHKVRQTEKTKKAIMRIPVAFHHQIQKVLSVYFEIHKALSEDEPKIAQKLSSKLEKRLSAVDMGILSEQAHLVWMKEFKKLKKQADALSAKSDINKQREAFYLVSEGVISVIKQLGATGKKPVFQFHCPMAFGGQGADWLQNKPDLQNPYFGKMMLKCGELVATLASPENSSQKQK